jgi:hypothetical protein
VGGNTLSATFYYTYIQVSDVTNDLQTPQLSPLTSDNSTLDLSLNYSRLDKLFKLPVIYSAVISGISDNLNTVRRFNFNGGLSFPLIQRANTSLAIGALLVIDPSSQTPVKPIINYYHKFTSSGVELIVDYPRQITVKKEVFKDGWLMFGTCQIPTRPFITSMMHC